MDLYEIWTQGTSRHVSSLWGKIKIPNQVPGSKVMLLEVFGQLGQLQESFGKILI
jgi:hypothetical protein